MKAKFETLQILCQIDELEQTLNTFIYGSIEIREKSKKKYIYIHNRYGKKTRTAFVGEYSEGALNEIKANNQRAKDIKKEIKRLRKELETTNFQEIDLADEVKQNIDFAKKEIVNTIYKQALLEGVNTTYAQTQAIIEGGKVKNMSAPDILKIINLKRAWDFILNKYIITSETDYYLLSEINKNVLDGFFINGGVVSSTPVKISGTSFRPPLPFADKVKEDINNITNSNESVLDKAIDLLLYVMKYQIFIDGNKRCGVIFANHMLIKNGEGLIVIPDNLIEEYRLLLIDHYEGKDESTIRDFLKEKCYTPLKA